MDYYPSIVPITHGTSDLAMTLFLCLSAIGLMIATLYFALMWVFGESSPKKMIQSIITEVKEMLSQEEEDAANLTAEERAMRAAAFANYMNPGNEGFRMPLFIPAEKAQPSTTASLWKRGNGEEDLSLLLTELQIHLNVTPHIDGYTLQVTRSEFRRLVEFCNFYFEKPLTPEEAFLPYGLLVTINGK